MSGPDSFQPQFLTPSTKVERCTVLFMIVSH